MEFGLQIVGVMALAVLTSAGLVLFWFRSRMNTDQLDLFAEGGYPLPARITLQRYREFGTAFCDADSNSGVVAAMHASGFVTVTEFEIAQIPGVTLRGMFHPGLDCAAAIYENGESQPAFEVFRVYDDNSLITVTTNTLVDPAGVPPDDRLISVEDLTPDRALQLLDNHDSRQPRRRIDDRNFVEEFEQAYARSMDWKIKRGRYSDEFLRAITCRLTTRDPNEEELAAAREALEIALKEEIPAACLGNYLRAATLTAGAWEKIRERVFVIHDRMDRCEMLQLIACCLGERQTERLFGQIEFDSDDDNLTLLERINASLPDRERILQLGRVNEPVAAAICQAP